MKSIHLLQNKNKYVNKVVRNLEAIILGIAFIFAFSVILYGGEALLNYLGVRDVFIKMNGDVYVDFLGISYSVIFLTTSLLTMLSDKNATIYWLRVNEYILIYPKIFNYYNCSVVGYLSLLVETVAFINCNYIVFCAGFIVGILSVVITYFRMISIYFKRENHLEDLKKIYNSEEGKRDDEEIFLQLQTFTIVAYDSHDDNIVEENLDFVIELAYGRETTNKYAAACLRYIFSYIGKNDISQIHRAVSKHKEIFAKSEQARYDLEEWITDDSNFVDLWKALNVQYKLLEQVEQSIKKHWPLGPDVDIEDDELVVRLIKNYEEFMVKKVGFFIDNSLWNDFEKVLSFILKNPDPIEWLYDNPEQAELFHMMYTKGGILDTILDMVYMDDKAFMEYIYRYHIVAKSMAYDVHVDDRKEAGFLCQLVLMFNFKKEQSPKLKAIYHQFMCGSTSKEAYQFYVHSLLEDLPDSESYLKLAISYWKAESFMIWELECPNEMAEEEKAKAVEDIQKDLVFLREIHEKVSGYDVAETISEFEKQLQDIIQGLITDEDSSVDGYMWR